MLKAVVRLKSASGPCVAWSLDLGTRYHIACVVNDDLFCGLAISRLQELIGLVADDTFQQKQ